MAPPAPGGLTRRRSLGLAGAATAGLLAHAVTHPGEAQAAPGGSYIVVDAAGGADYTAIEPAVAGAPAGATIFVRQGTYTVSTGNMNPAAGVVITGSGYGTHIRAKDGLNTSIFRIQNDRVVIENLRVDGNGQNNNQSSGNCIVFKSTGGKILDCFVHDSPGYNIVGEPPGGHWVIQGNHSYSTFASSASVPREGIELQGVSWCSVVGNTVSDIDQNGILVWNSSGDAGFNTVVGNTVRSCQRAGIGLEDGAHDNTISGNAIVDCNWGVWSTGNGPSGAPRNNAITGNTIASTSQMGVEIDGGPGTVLSDNVVRNAGSNGIWLLDARDCSVTGNSIEGSRLAGILIQNSSNVICSSNVSNDNGKDTSSSNRRAGIVLTQVGGTTANNQLANNRCRDTQSSKTQLHGIAIYGNPDNTLLQGNLLDGNGSSTHALLISGSPTKLHAVPFRRLSANVGNSPTAVPHGLPYAPLTVVVSPTSNAKVWRTSGSTATNVYLQADGPNKSADVFVG